MEAGPGPADGDLADPLGIRKVWKMGSIKPQQFLIQVLPAQFTVYYSKRSPSGTESLFRAVNEASVVASLT